MSLFNSKLDSDIDTAAQALYTAAENIRDISLGIRRADDAVHQEKLNEIANQLVYEGEFEINQVALAKGLYFFPRYLNETIQDYPEDGATNFFVPATVRSHGQ
jgi:hypothetical protein